MGFTAVCKILAAVLAADLQMQETVRQDGSWLAATGQLR